MRTTTDVNAFRCDLQMDLQNVLLYVVWQPQSANYVSAASCCRYVWCRYVNLEESPLIDLLQDPIVAFDKGSP